MNNTGPIRRADLYLRTEYPEFITKIYRIEENKFLIHIENLCVDFSMVQENFNTKLKPPTSPVDLSKTKPKNFIEVVPCMLDTEISKGLEGVLMSKPELIHLLAIKFPKINFYKITDDAGIINLHIAEYQVKEGNLTKIKFLDRFSRKALEDFITNYKSTIKFNIIIDKFDEKPVLTEGFSKEEKGSFIYVNSQLSKPKYIQRDESLWYDNVDGIFEGSFVKKDLFFYDKEEYSCYVDFSVFPNIDLRYHLMLYEIIYLSPPLNKKMNDWLKTLSITRNEFIELIVRERIKLVLVQNEVRYDLDFINEVYDILPNAIISKRALSCLQQCDIVELSDNYIFNSVECIQELKYVSETSPKTKGISDKQIYEMMIWPIKARRNSFEILHRSGILSASLYGVNATFADPLNYSHSEVTDFVMKVYSPSIHLAHSLNATYFPFISENGHTDEKYAETMGKMLNLFKYSTLDSLKSLTDAESLLEKGNSFIAPVNLIRVNDFESILDFEAVLNKEIVFPNSKRLIESLSELSPEEQTEKINYYNREVNRFSMGVEKTYRRFDFSVQTLNALVGLSTGVPTGPILTAIKLGKNSLFKKYSPIRHILEKIEQAMEPNIDRQNIHFLSKINRVAKLKD